MDTFWFTVLFVSAFAMFLLFTWRLVTKKQGDFIELLGVEKSIFSLGIIVPVAEAIWLGAYWLFGDGWPVTNVVHLVIPVIGAVVIMGVVTLFNEWKDWSIERLRSKYQDWLWNRDSH